MRYTIINFTRLGDLLQTQSTIAALKKSSPPAYDLKENENNATHKGDEKNKISLICLEQFVSAAHFIEELDDISVFESSSILKLLHKDWRCAMEELETWVNTYYEKFPYDVIINLTASMNCRVFAHLLSRKAPHIKLEGFGLDSFGYGQNSSVWTTYIQAVIQERGCSPYNLIDGFRSMLEQAPEPFQLKKPSQNLQKNALAFLQQERDIFLKKFKLQENSKENISFIAFQLGASNAVRQWDIEHFAYLGHMLWKKNYIPVLLGATQDKPLANAYIEASKKLNQHIPCINLCGKTTLKELGALLTQVSALVSNDTGTLHLAVGLGTPVLGIYLATAQVWDTGPYGIGHLCLEPQLKCHPCSFSHVCEYDNKCRKFISPQSVYDGLSFLLKKKAPETSPKENPCEKQKKLFLESVTSADARVWYSYFDDDGFATYQSLSGDENSDRTLWMACQRLFYKSFLQRFSNTHKMKTLIRQNLSSQNQETQNEHAKILPMQNLGAKHNTCPTKHNYKNTQLPLKNILLIQENIAFIERVLSLILLLKEQATILNMRPSIKLQENFLSSIERINLYLSQNPSFTPLFLLWKNLVQEHSQSIESLIHFFDTLHEELSLFNQYLISASK